MSSCPVVIQIIPTLPPAISGLGDYGNAIDQSVQGIAGLHSQFLVSDPQCNTRLFSTRATMIPSRNRTAIESSVVPLLDRCQRASILVHYCGYAYQKRGCPLWLPIALEGLKRTLPQTRIITMFHELYAFGPVWRSSFWLSGVQRYLCRRMLDVSDAVVTNTPISAAMLSTWRPEKPVRVLSIPSNVGEPSDIPALANREPVIAIFGQLGTRVRAWKAIHSRGNLLDKVSEVWDIGPGRIELNKKVLIPVRRFGNQEHSVISNLLSRARYGLISYPYRFLSKSSVFAAYAAHGVLPVVYSSDSIECLSLKASIHFVPWVREAFLNAERQQQIAQNAWAWYQEHTLPIHGRVFADLLAA